MRRKSERNKTKGTPEKKVEKPTRRTTRRRGKASPSPSPDRETPDDNVSSTPSLGEEKTSEFQPEEQSNDNEDTEQGVSSSELIKSVLGGGGEEEDNGSVWKVARADASPGQIQKLKICRQRNISEASDSSLSRKKSNKWPDDGEGGMEEADSADEQIASSQIVMSNQTDDASSMHPGQDSSEEVSEHKENLPETTSANLSDDKTNIDQLAELTENVTDTSAPHSSEPVCEDNQSTENLPNHESNLNPSLYDGTSEVDFSAENACDQQNEVHGNSNDPAPFNSIASESQQFNEDTQSLNEIHIDPGASVQENLQLNNDQTINESEVSYDDQSESCGGIDASCDQPPSSVDETQTLNNEPVISYQDDNAMEGGVFNQDTILEQKSLLSGTFESSGIVITESNDGESSVNQEHLIRTVEEQEDGEIKDEALGEQSPESDSVSNNRDASVTRDAVDSNSPSAGIGSTEKLDHHRESTSQSPRSNDEQDQQSGLQNEAKESNEIEDFMTENTTKKKKHGQRHGNHHIRSASSEKQVVSSNNEPELELSESIGDKEDILEISEKTDDLNVTLNTVKPAKVSLKRSFSTRLSTDGDGKKEHGKSNEASSEPNHDKENHVVNEQLDQKGATKRRRWGTTTSNDVAPAFSISTDSLKALVPGAKPLSVNEVRLTKDEDKKEHRKRRSEENRERRSRDDSVSKEHLKPEDSNSENHIAPKRRITVVKEAPRPTSPSPAEAQATNILLIRNLVRPFTLTQIKELLSRTGTIAENGFWIDRIKSKCYVEYSNEDQAFETRQALHGVSWPMSNPKKLIVEYANKEDMEKARESSLDQPVLRKAEPVVSNDIWHQDQWSHDERTVAANKVTIIREWDMGKEDGQLNVKEKEKERKEFEKKKRQRSRSPARETHLPAPARKFKKKEEEPPTAKLLDDLFRKTKSTPCIYWLPLTNEQIVVKEEMRRQHMAEHARRIEEIERAKRGRDPRRRRSPRK